MIGQFVCVLVRFLVLWWETMTKNNLGGKNLVYLTTPRSQSSTTESQGRNWSRDCRTLHAPLACSACFSYMSQVHLGSTIHNGLGPSASVINQENTSQACLQNSLVNWGFSLFEWLCFYQLLEKNNTMWMGSFLNILHFSCNFWRWDWVWSTALISSQKLAIKGVFIEPPFKKGTK